ncbi:MAG: patatin-like phospholipase family protein [Pyrinomonadaceae bacterium]
MARKTIGLALSGGGARGFAHVGVLKVLSDNDIPIDYIAGTSAGAFVGGAYASGMSADEILEAGSGFNWLNVAGIAYSPRGLLSNAKMKAFADKYFPAQTFEDLKIPFAATACDIESGDEVIFSNGDMVLAIRASCAIPGVFMPVEDSEGRMFIDGGVVSPVPINAIKAFGPDIVIAVDLMACGASFWGKPMTFVGTIFQSAMMLLRSASRNQHYAADVVIAPEIAHIRPDQMSRATELFELGKAAAENEIGKIKELLADHKNARA